MMRIIFLILSVFFCISTIQSLECTAGKFSLSSINVSSTTTIYVTNCNGSVVIADTVLDETIKEYCLDSTQGTYVRISGDDTLVTWNITDDSGKLVLSSVSPFEGYIRCSTFQCSGSTLVLSNKVNGWGSASINISSCDNTLLASNVTLGPISNNRIEFCLDATGVKIITNEANTSSVKWTLYGSDRLAIISGSSPFSGSAGCECGTNQSLISFFDTEWAGSTMRLMNCQGKVMISDFEMECTSCPQDFGVCIPQSSGYIVQLIKGSSDSAGSWALTSNGRQLLDGKIPFLSSTGCATDNIYFSKYFNGPNNTIMEIYNPNCNSVNLEGSYIVIGGSKNIVFPLSKTLNSTKVLVFCQYALNNTQICNFTDSNFTVGPSDYVKLLSHGALVDLIGSPTSVPPQKGWSILDIDSASVVEGATQNHLIDRPFYILNGVTEWRADTLPIWNVESTTSPQGFGSHSGFSLCLEDCNPVTVTGKVCIGDCYAVTVSGRNYAGCLVGAFYPPVERCEACQPRSPSRSPSPTKGTRSSSPSRGLTPTPTTTRKPVSPTASRTISAAAICGQERCGTYLEGAFCQCDHNCNSAQDCCAGYKENCGSSSNGGLTNGAIAGAIIAPIFAVGAAGALFIFFKRRGGLKRVPIATVVSAN